MFEATWIVETFEALHTSKMFCRTFNRCIHQLVIIALASLNVVQCISFGNLFDGLSNLNPFHSRRSLVTVEQCTIFKKRRKCLFNTKNLRLENSNRLRLVASVGGRIIECIKKLGFGKNQWYGSCDGDADDANFVSHFDQHGKQSIYGSIHIGDEICHIGPSVFGEDEIQCIPRSEFQAEDEAIEMPNEGNHDERRILSSDTQFGYVPIIGKSQSQALLRGERNQRKNRRLFDDSGDTIDILVAWTKLAECLNAGLLSGCSVTSSTERMMRGRIDLAIAETNTAFALSGVFTSLRLVHAYRDPDYIESDDVYTSLAHVTTPNDGFMDSVHNQRILYGADVVSLISGA